MRVTSNCAGELVTLPVYDLCKLTPAEVTLDVVSSSIEGGRSLSGITQAIDMSGGGYVVATYAGIAILTRDQHRYWNELAGILNGSVNAIALPLWTDLLLGAAPDHDGTIAAAALHATQVSITHDPADLVPGAWFSISHADPIGPRAYRVHSVGAISAGAYPCEIRPALRAAVTAGTVCNFSRPQCRMRLPAGTTLPWVYQAPGGYSIERSIDFVEAW